MEIICKSCGEKNILYAKGMCRKCYRHHYHLNDKNSYIRNTINGELIELTIDKTILTEKEATKYVEFKRKQILEDATKNPKKYLYIEQAEGK